MNPLVLLLTAAIVVGYAVALWRLLRSEPASNLWLVAVLTAVALLLRLIEWSRFPGGLNSDEVTILMLGAKALPNGFSGDGLFGEGATGLPQLVPVLFQAQLVPLLGAGRWAIRLYSTAGGVLSVAATFAVARAMRMRSASSLAAAAFVTFLPWSLLYGRISQGGELVFNQLLLLAAVARLIWKDGGWREVPGGALGLWLLFYDYFSGRALLAMPIIGAVLARGWNRLWCLAIGVVAIAGFLPQALQGHRYGLVGFSFLQVHEGYSAQPLNTLATKLIGNLSAFAYPVGATGWMTVQDGAVHPWLILGLARLGLLTGFRRMLFLTGGFLIGLMPNVVAHGALAASTHRMLSAYVFISLAAGASFDLIPWRSLRATLAAAVVAYAGFWSVNYYFSSEFWRDDARWMFDSDSTDVVESASVDDFRVFAVDLEGFIALRTDLKSKVTPFGVDDLYLNGPGRYLFSGRLISLKQFYEAIIPRENIASFGRAFSIRVGPWNNDWLRRHGWTYQIRCGDIVRSGPILTLFHLFYTFRDVNCDEPAQHLWKGRWLGPTSQLRVWFGDSLASVTTPLGTVTATAGTPSLDFNAEPGDEITIQVASSARALMTLYVVTERQERLPHWEWVEPLPLE